ncbi:MAG: CPBP family glutamic-type intramembrane protease [Telluria sp.]
MTAVGTGRAIWLLARLRLQRLANMTTSLRLGGKARQAKASRAATPSKRRMGGLFAILMVATMMFSFVNMAHRSVLNMDCTLLADACQSQDARHRDVDLAAQDLAQHGFSEPLQHTLALQVALLLIVSFLAPLGSREIASADWDLEWLVTLPVRRPTLLAARIAERSVANPFGLFALFPPAATLAWFAGHRWGAPVVGLAGALALLPIAAVLRTIADTGLRMRLAPSKLRNLQALCSVGSLPFMYLAMSFGMPSGVAVMKALQGHIPAWLMWTPPGLVVEAITANTRSGSMMAIALLLAQVALCVALGMGLLARQLRHGVVASGERESARSKAPPVSAASGRAGFLERLLPRSVIQRRELRLLARDRNFLVQSLLMPVVIVGGQFVLSGSPGAFARLAASPVALGLTAWGISAYMLMLSALQTLNNEGQALWMLYTFPRPIASVLKEKAQMWAALALVYPVAVLALGIFAAPHFDWRTLSTFAIVLAGIPVYSTIAVALGVFACDPLSQDVRQKVRPSYVYLYMLLSGMYGYAIYAEKWVQSVVVVVLTAGLALALWQKARDALPYLLDPAAAPPPRVSTADGMMAAMLFFVLQAAAFLLCTRGLDVETGPAVVMAFLAAGAFVYAVVRLTYWRTKTIGVPGVLAGRGGHAIAWGLAGGLAAACVGVGYLHVLRTTAWWPELQAGAGSGIDARWLLPLAVLLAPLFEEFIFRGLVFGGLRRSMPLAPSMVMSAGLFAIVHPPVSMLPVFVLGLCTAWVYDRSKGLLAPMLVHAVYNAVVLGYQM